MEKEKYTPIKDRVTGDPIQLGDICKNEKAQTGIVVWDEYFNKYLLKSETGGNIHSRTYTKVKELKPNNIDTTKVECRNNPNKIKW